MVDVVAARVSVRGDVLYLHVFSLFDICLRYVSSVLVISHVLQCVVHMTLRSLRAVRTHIVNTKRAILSRTVDRQCYNVCVVHTGDFRSVCVTEYLHDCRMWRTTRACYAVLIVRELHVALSWSRVPARLLARDAIEPQLL